MLESFKKDRLGADGTYKDFCAWYGGDCGVCFHRKMRDPVPVCFERNEHDLVYDRKKNLAKPVR